MLLIDKSGRVISSRVTVRIFPNIERGAMTSINGIVVHQTDASQAQSTFSSYVLSKPNGAHFLIDKDGAIFQTASVYKIANHVGRIKARCVIENRCSPTDTQALRVFNPTAENDREQLKAHPDRFPTNSDSIGIELVGISFADPKPGNPSNRTYESVTDEQNRSLKWLVGELSTTLRLSLREVFRHPVVSRKMPSEAATAVWQ